MNVTPLKKSQKHNGQVVKSINLGNFGGKLRKCVEDNFTLKTVVEDETRLNIR